MASLKKFENNPQQQLMSEIKGSRCVMLGSPNSNEHMQPMAPQIDDKNSEIIYFFSDNTSDLGKAVAQKPGYVHLCHIDKDYQACIRGKLSQHTDKSTVDEFWNPIVSSWYPGGKDDPKMMMLKFEPDSAAIWASDKSTIGFLYETTKANIKDTWPEVGASKVIDIA
ncbi:MAG: general stress protein [Acidimicrobiales bacterium]|nr:pyridoxamine 5'-phosphate oxidase family protein [Hyphomonadaceae bacterium]RZV44493.1 MAG: general stress protein [Acidimicrobiales bacterium]